MAIAVAEVQRCDWLASRHDMNDSENRTENEIAINAIDSVLIQGCKTSWIQHQTFMIHSETQMVSDGKLEARDRSVCMHQYQCLVLLRRLEAPELRFFFVTAWRMRLLARFMALACEGESESLFCL